jgi:NDP-sugar pyrophosphorylase family protein
LRALVLAAGCGERLRPLTADRPKPMIEIGGKPVLEYNIELLARAGVREAVVNLHYRPEAIRSHFGDGHRFGMTIAYEYEPALLGTAGAARNAAGRLRNGDFLVVYGDNLSTIDIAALVAFHVQKNADLTVALYRRDDPGSSGIVAVDEESRITRFLEKPRADEIFSHWVNAGYLVAKSWILDAIPAGRQYDFGRDLLPSLIRDGARVYGYCMTERLWWIDSLEDYRRTQAAFAGRAT